MRRASALFKYFTPTDLHILSKCKPCFLYLQAPDQQALT